jgi:hypothetical protein
MQSQRGRVGSKMPPSCASASAGGAWKSPSKLATIARSPASCPKQGGYRGKESAQRIIEAMNTTSMPSKVGSFAPTDFPEPPLGLASQSLCRPRMTSTPVGQSALEPSHSRWSKRARTATTI